MNNIDKFKKDFESLNKLASKMIRDLRYQIKAITKTLPSEDQDDAKMIEMTFQFEYQRWYTESCVVIKQLIPERLGEFKQHYEVDNTRGKNIFDNYRIMDFMWGRILLRQAKPEESYIIALNLLQNQKRILKSVKGRFDSTLFDIKQLVAAELYDSELDAARDLIKSGFLRAAGAISGVVLEKHLKQVADNHNIKTTKKNPGISDFNDLLKNEGVIDLPSWRQIQFLGDIRNLCDHDRDREPTKNEVEDLVNGVEKITKTLF